MINDAISVIIPAYNNEKELARTLDSVLAQTHENLEIIVVNDGSGDGTAAVIDDYAARSPKIRAVHKENGGVTSARLRGVAEAAGDWIGFVDGDDLVEPQMFERLLENALECGVDISHCGYQMVFPNGRVDHYYNTGRILEQNWLEGMQDLLEGRFVEPGLCNKLFRRELFVGLEAQLDQTIKNNEDLLMNYYLFKAASCAVYEDVCPYHYILRENSASTAPLNEHRLLDPIRVTKAILADAAPELHATVLSRLSRQLVNLASMSASEHRSLILPHRRTARKELRSRLGEILRTDIGAKLKIMALWAMIFPASYRWVHMLYEKVTGIDKKYALN